MTADEIALTAASAAVLLYLLACLICADAAARRRHREGFCHVCDEARVKSGETECESCWLDRQW